MVPRQRHMRKRSKTRVVPLIFLSLFAFLLIAGGAFAVGMLGNVSRWLSNLPDYTDANEYLVSEPTHVLDANGTEIATFFVQNRRSVEKDQVSKYVLEGTVDVEDERFYDHNGVDIIGIGRAVVAQFSGRSEGASTITQQLVRNTILSEEQFDQTIERKVREAYIAIKMEELFSKDEILMMYLNTIYYGHGAYGIEAASQTYFSKSAKDLTLPEAALLIGLPNSPTYYDPTANPEGAVERRNKVLDNMLRLGHITQGQHDEAQAAPLELNVTETSSTGVTVYSQPYFVDYVKSLLQEEFSTDVLFKGGLTVRTTIDPDIQSAAETAAVENINKYPNAASLDIGMTVIDPKTGYIKAMVGGRDYNADQSRVNHATSKRQPGSSFKSYTLATAIHMGMNPNISVYCGSPIYFKYNGEQVKIQNYGNHNYGTRSLASATAVSSNTGYVQIAEALGNQNIIAMCKELGLDTSQMEDVPSMTLGTGTFSTLQMASAYGTFAAGGTHHEAIAITEIDSRDGKVLYQHQDKTTQPLTTGEAAAVTEVLEAVMKRGGTGVYGAPDIDQPVAGKTGTAGTATDTTNLWFCGYTPQYSVSIWVGDTDGNVPIKGLDNSKMTLPVFKNFMETVLANTAREEFPEGEKPNYKSNSSWKFSRTFGNSDEEEEETTSVEEEENAENITGDDGYTGGGTGTETGGNAGTGGGTGAGEPTAPTTPAEPTAPTEPTNPGGATGGGETGGGSSGGETGGGTGGGGTGGTGGGTGGTTGGGTGTGAVDGAGGAA